MGLLSSIRYPSPLVACKIQKTNDLYDYMLDL
jgi:hypothetical protein